MQTSRFRSDGRLAQETRAVFLRANCLKHASGSAYVSWGGDLGTRVYVGVFGPRPSQRGRQAGGMASQKGELVVDLFVADGARSAAANSSTATSSQQQLSDGDRALQIDVARTLESVVRLEDYAKSSIEVRVTVLQDDGSLLPAILTCAGMAVADAGISCRDIISFASVAAVGLDEAIAYWPKLGKALEDGAAPESLGVRLWDNERAAALLDLSLEEEEYFERRGALTKVLVGICPGRDCLCAFHATGRLLSEEGLAFLMALGDASCRNVCSELQDCLTREFLRKEQQLPDKSIQLSAVS